MTLSRSISKNSLLLLAFALCTAALLAGTYEGTKKRITEAQRQAAEKALLEIVPSERIDNDLLLDTIDIPKSAWSQLGLNEAAKIHVAKKNNKVIAIILPATAPDGYSGDIHMIAGINRNGTIAGVRVLSHKETPGLGDKVDLRKTPWILDFDGKSLIDPSKESWKVKKDGGYFDQFTGATITPRAVVNQIFKVLSYVEQEKAWLFEQKTETDL